MKIKFLSIALMAILIALCVPGVQADNILFNHPGTFEWTVPANVTFVNYTIVGGGGGGGSASGGIPGSYGLSGGGGGSGYVENGTVGVFPGDILSITVGEGGDWGYEIPTDNTAGGVTGADGGESSFGMFSVGGGEGGLPAPLRTASITYGGAGGIGWNNGNISWHPDGSSQAGSGNPAGFPAYGGAGLGVNNTGKGGNGASAKCFGIAYSPVSDYAGASDGSDGMVSLSYYPNQTLDIPLDKNITVTVESTTGFRIPRVNVEIHDSMYSYVAGPTDINGEATFSLVSMMSTFHPYIVASKVGYNTTIKNITDSYYSMTEIEETVILEDAVSIGPSATVFLDIADIDTGFPIEGATVGIQNTTATIGQWRYNTYPASTIAFNTTGSAPEIPISVGQSVIFAGYKSGEYSANNTGNYLIHSATSRLTLYLEKTEGNETAYYHFPVTITDSITGNAIGGSTLSSTLLNSCDIEVKNCAWYNQTSGTGKFNITGTGTSGSDPLGMGDELVWEGNAIGYARNGYAIKLREDNNGITQYLNLAPVSVIPRGGEFTAVINVYNEDTSTSVSGVYLVLKEGSNISALTTLSSGSATFKNLSSSRAYTLTATKSGFTTLTKTVIGSSGSIEYVDLPLSPTSVNPTSTPTVVPTSTYGPVSSDDDVMAWIRGKAIGILDFLYLLVVLGGLGLIMKVWGGK